MAHSKVKYIIELWRGKCLIDFTPLSQEMVEEKGFWTLFKRLEKKGRWKLKKVVWR